MNRNLPWGWIALGALVLLLPGPAGRVLLDLLGGLTLTLLLLPLLAGGAALVGWQLLKRRLKVCSACGFSSVGSQSCPACGSRFDDLDPTPERFDEVDARSATITVNAVDVKATPADASKP